MPLFATHFTKDEKQADHQCHFSICSFRIVRLQYRAFTSISECPSHFQMLPFKARQFSNLCFHTE